MTQYRDGISAIVVGLLVGIGWTAMVRMHRFGPPQAERPPIERADDALDQERFIRSEVLATRALHLAEIRMFPASHPPPPVRDEARVTPVFARETQFVGTHR